MNETQFQAHNPDAFLNEIELVLRAQAGDRQAVERLLEGVYPALRRYVVSLVGATEADDVAQDTLIQAYRKLVWLEEPKYFRAWLYRIASRLAFARLKKNKRWGSMEDQEVAMIAAIPVLPAIEWAATFEALLEKVSPASRAVLQLHYGSELTLDEVAAALEIPMGTVKSRLSYGVVSLRQILKEKTP